MFVKRESDARVQEKNERKEKGRGEKKGVLGIQWKFVWQSDEAAD